MKSIIYLIIQFFFIYNVFAQDKKHFSQNRKLTFLPKFGVTYYNWTGKNKFSESQTKDGSVFKNSMESGQLFNSNLQINYNLTNKLTVQSNSEYSFGKTTFEGAIPQIQVSERLFVSKLTGKGYYSGYNQSLGITYLINVNNFFSVSPILGLNFRKWNRKLPESNDALVMVFQNQYNLKEKKLGGEIIFKIKNDSKLKIRASFLNSYNYKVKIVDTKNIDNGQTVVDKQIAYYLELPFNKTEKATNEYIENTKKIYLGLNNYRNQFNYKNNNKNFNFEISYNYKNLDFCFKNETLNLLQEFDAYQPKIKAGFKTIQIGYMF
jgi:hypothetical protein